MKDVRVTGSGWGGLDWEWAMMGLGLRWLFGLCVLHKQRLTLLLPFATSAPLQRDVIYDCWFPASHSHAHWVALPYLWVYWQLNAGLINYFELKVFRRFISRKIKIEVNLPCLMCNCPPFETVDHVGGGGSDEEMDSIRRGLLFITSFAKWKQRWTLFNNEFPLKVFGKEFSCHYLPFLPSTPVVHWYWGT